MIHKTLTCVFFCIAILIAVAPKSRAADADKTLAGTCLVYVGTYTGEKSKGIYAYNLDLAGGKFTPLGLLRSKTHRFWPCTPTASFCMR